MKNLLYYIFFAVFKIWLASICSSELQILLWPNLVWWYVTISKRILWKDCFAMFKVKITATVQKPIEWLSRWYLLSNSEPFVARLNMMMYHQSVMWKEYFAIFMAKVTVGAHTFKFDYFYLQNCWSIDATNLSLMVHRHKLECLVKRLVCYVQGQGHIVLFFCAIFTVTNICATKLNVLMCC